MLVIPLLVIGIFAVTTTSLEYLHESRGIAPSNIFLAWSTEDSTIEPTLDPTIEPTLSHPSSQPSSEPSCQPTYQPSSQPSTQPSSQPSCQPSSQPSCQPSSQPTCQPSCQPSTQPSSQPSLQPSSQPSCQPSSQPSVEPSAQPSLQPSNMPSQPTSEPSSQPSPQPSPQPSSAPSVEPSRQPSVRPSNYPSSNPTKQPSAQPTANPSKSTSGQPTCTPLCYPTSRPSNQPTSQPSTEPTVQPSSKPSTVPSHYPSSTPSLQPSNKPSSCPTRQPISMPSALPSSEPSSQPSITPSRQPSSSPSTLPTSQPSSIPSTGPTFIPTSNKVSTIQPFAPVASSSYLKASFSVTQTLFNLSTSKFKLPSVRQAFIKTILLSLDTSLSVNVTILSINAVYTSYLHSLRHQPSDTTSNLQIAAFSSPSSSSHAVLTASQSGVSVQYSISYNVPYQQVQSGNVTGYYDRAANIYNSLKYSLIDKVGSGAFDKTYSSITCNQGTSTCVGTISNAVPLTVTQVVIVEASGSPTQSPTTFSIQTAAVGEFNNLIAVVVSIGVFFPLVCLIWVFWEKLKEHVSKEIGNTLYKGYTYTKNRFTKNENMSINDTDVVATIVPDLVASHAMVATDEATYEKNSKPTTGESKLAVIKSSKVQSGVKSLTAGDIIVMKPGQTTMTQHDFVLSELSWSEREREELAFYYENIAKLIRSKHGEHTIVKPNGNAQQYFHTRKPVLKVPIIDKTTAATITSTEKPLSPTKKKVQPTVRFVPPVFLDSTERPNPLGARFAASSELQSGDSARRVIIKPVPSSPTSKQSRSISPRKL